ncbi:MAG: hypothetical protein JF612_06285, partial [Planctomycetia bacterium]|nr:hypothetical protein [Planctomycetia bacterium]
EYLLGEMRSTGDEPIPPQYRDFVDRYYKVIAAEGKNVQLPMTTPAAPADKKNTAKKNTNKSKIDKKQ